VPPLVEVRKVSFAYGRHEVFRDINLELEDGHILCILGPNGCGKTTLLDCILGILKPTRGTVLVKGKPVSSISAREMARQVAYVPQIHERTFPYLVKDLVLMGRASYLGLFSSPSREDEEIAEWALQEVGMSRFRDRPYTQLSGGEGQLVMIARALAQKTPIIIMDEPTAHLDFRHELIVLETMVRLVRDTGVSILMATHFPNHAFFFENHNLPTTVAMMHRAGLAALGPPSKVLSEAKLREVYGIDARTLTCELDRGRTLRYVVAVNTLSGHQGGACAS
jgi:iron complex transport system ATP-binding protein